LGETRVIERRRPEVCCWNRREYERLVATTPCECSPADFEWLVIHFVSALLVSPKQCILSCSEWGYRRDDVTDRCVLDADFETNVPSNCSTGYVSYIGVARLLLSI